MDTDIEQFQISVKLVLHNKAGDVLVLQAHDGDFTGPWDLPGGRINKDEVSLNMSEIIHREIEEEIGAIEYTLDEQPKAVGKATKIDGTSTMYLIFEGNYLEGEVRISTEHRSYKWVKLENINPTELFANGLLEAIINYLA